MTKEEFNGRNKIIFILFGVISILTFFLPFHRGLIMGSGYDVIFVNSNVSKLFEQSIDEVAASSKPSIGVFALIVISLIAYYPVYPILIGVFYLIRGFTTSFESEKINKKIFRPIEGFSFVLWLAWVILFMDMNKGSNAFLNFSSGFYLFTIAGLSKFFLEARVENVEAILINEQASQINSSSSNNKATDFDFYYRKDQENKGPLKLGELKLLNLDENDFIWIKEWNDWKQIKDTEFKEDIVQVQPPPFKTSIPPIFKSNNIIPPPFTKK